MITQKQNTVMITVEPKKDARSTLNPMIARYISPKNNPRLILPRSLPTKGICAAIMENVEISSTLPALAKSEGRKAESFVATVTISTEIARSHAISLMLHFSSPISTG